MTSPPPLPSPPAPSARPPLRPRLVVLGVFFLVFATACGLPAIYFDNKDVWVGSYLLALGWMGVFVGQLAWFANLGILAAALCLLLNWHRAARVIAVLSLLVGAHTFALLHQVLPMDEGGVVKATVIGIGSAAYVWLASIAVLAIGSLLVKPARSPHV